MNHRSIAVTPLVDLKWRVLKTDAPTKVTVKSLTAEALPGQNLGRDIRVRLGNLGVTLAVRGCTTPHLLDFHRFEFVRDSRNETWVLITIDPIQNDLIVMTARDFKQSKYYAEFQEQERRLLPKVCGILSQQKS